MIDVHPLVPQQDKARYVVRPGFAYPLGARGLPEGTEVLAHPETVRASYSHILAPLDEPDTAAPEAEEAGAPDVVETEETAVKATDARTKAARRSPRSK